MDNGSTDGTADWLEECQRDHDNVRVVHCDHVIGDAAGKNIGLKQSRGRHIIIVDASTEIVGDLLSAVEERLSDETVGIFGPYGLSTDDMRHFHEEVDQGDADAMQAYCMAFRRDSMQQVGLMHEGFRFYRNLDIDYSFQFKEKGLPGGGGQHTAVGAARAPAVGGVGRQPAGRVEPEEFWTIFEAVGTPAGPAGYVGRTGLRHRVPPLGFSILVAGRGLRRV